jgi:hypothetical protein
LMDLRAETQSNARAQRSEDAGDGV